MQDIPFTFGIITFADKGVYEHLPAVVKSIRSLKIPQYEILIVGKASVLNAHPVLNEKKHTDIRIIDFNESAKSKWITKKKNLITKHAKYENVVYQHDYIWYDENWYEGFKKFGDNFTVCMTKIKNLDGTRYRDWVIFPYHHAGRHPAAESLWKFCDIRNNQSMIPYDEKRFTKFQYISGAYWVAKKSIMQRFPLDESLTWGQGEDVRWSDIVRKHVKFSMNANSTVHLFKQHNPAFSPMRPPVFARLEKYLAKVIKGEIKGW